MRAAPFLIMAFLWAPFACVREAPFVVAPVELVDGGALPDATAPFRSSTVATATGRCTARLRASPIRTNDGCTLDERISSTTGTLSYPCAGANGDIEAVFGEHHFRGTLTNDVVDLTLSTELDWDDGCHWETRQSIRGNFRRESPSSSKWLWSYEEHPVRGASCFGSCKASADIELEPRP